jgi:hypothetical protein
MPSGHSALPALFSEGEIVSESHQSQFRLPNCILCGEAPQVGNQMGVQIRIQCPNKRCPSHDAIDKNYDVAAAEWISMNTPILIS